MNPIQPQFLPNLSHIESIEWGSLQERNILKWSFQTNSETFFDAHEQPSTWLFLSLALTQIDHLLLRTLKVSSFLKVIKHLPEILKKAPSLEVLEIESWPEEDISALFSTIGTYCRKLHTLRIRNLPSTQKIDLAPLHSSIELRHLELANTQAELTGVDQFLHRAGSNLEILRLAYLHQLTNETLQKFTTCSQLRSLNISGCAKLTSLPPFLGLERLSLRELNLCLDQTDVSKLQALNISNSISTSKKDLEPLLSKAEKMEYVDIRDCLLSMEEVDALRQRFLSVTFLGNP